MNGIKIMEDFLQSTRAIDLTLTLEEGMPKWPTQPPFSAVTYEALEWGFDSYHRGISMCEHTGTHIDAACHFVAGTDSIEKLPLTQIMGRGVKIDAVGTGPRASLGLDKVLEFEKQYGEIKEGDIVFFHFGWDYKYALKPDGQEFLKDWPGIAPEVGEYLRGKKVKAVGCDALALDADGTDFQNHVILLGNKINIIENVANLSKLPPFFSCVGLPLKVKNGSGAPLRLVAFVDKK
ncbi:cyclase family protein [Hespellia stercorisuis]|uniref:Kynurenine formamidase n=1 Tax=Hespellia stercorisuis DSM 15480 TaxID=1121950 RepID=A0A1M6UPJ9_9FIRM|nr:cyclase family protein [Hespellia stercorisuis]SHK71091.1 Kynurenine formamidase [Hespellia stercorisuis DSM 15480]